jgi:hypothetical protein
MQLPQGARYPTLPYNARSRYTVILASVLAKWHLLGCRPLQKSGHSLRRAVVKEVVKKVSCVFIHDVLPHLPFNQLWQCGALCIDIRFGRHKAMR